MDVRRGLGAIGRVLCSWQIRSGHEGAGRGLVANVDPVESPIDDRALAALEKFQRPGRPDVIVEVIERSLADTPALLTRARSAAANGDHADLGRVAHTLVGMSVVWGARELVSACRQLEARATAADADGAARSMTLVDASWEQLRTALVRLRSSRLEAAE